MDESADNNLVAPSSPTSNPDSNDPLEDEQSPETDLQNPRNPQKGQSILLDEPIQQVGDSDDELLLHGHLATTNNSSSIPNSYQQARVSNEGDQWQQAINDELAKMDSNPDSNDPLEDEQSPETDLQNPRNPQKGQSILLDEPIQQVGDSDDELLLHGHLATTNNSSSIPNSYQQARVSNEGDQWQQAINDELAKMDKYNV